MKYIKPPLHVRLPRRRGFLTPITAEGLRNTEALEQPFRGSNLDSSTWCCVSLGKWLRLSVPQLPPLCTVTNMTASKGYCEELASYAV